MNAANNCMLVGGADCCRSATGEAWQDIMMACANKASVVCDDESDSAGQRCGSSVAFPFFISFYVLCSFLVSRPDLQCARAV